MTVSENNYKIINRLVYRTINIIILLTLQQCYNKNGVLVIVIILTCNCSNCSHKYHNIFLNVILKINDHCQMNSTNYRALSA